jgi:cyanate lyase
MKEANKTNDKNLNKINKLKRGGKTLFFLIFPKEFGDGIMSAVDFRLRLQRSPEVQAAAADGAQRVQIVWDGKFLPYKPF